MKWILVLVLIVFATLLNAKTDNDKLSADRTWAYYEMGRGGLKGTDILSLNGGVSYAVNGKICFTIYKSLHDQNKEFMSGIPSKYTFKGHGVLIGPVIGKDKFQFIPSTGIEFGKMSVGENLMLDTSGFWDDYYWETTKQVTVTYIPVSLVGKYNLSSFLALRGKLGLNINRSYFLYNFSLGVCLGRV